MPAQRSRAVATLAPIFLIVVLAACGGASDATENIPADDPTTTQPAPTASEAAAGEESATGAGLCAMVPIDEVETALGMTTDGGIDEESFLTDGLSCRFTGDADHVLDVTASEQPRDEWFEQIETVGMTDEQVTGVGEEAYRAPETALGGPGARFTAWSEGHEVGVTVYSDQPQDVTFAAAEAIAEAVLAAGE